MKKSNIFWVSYSDLMTSLFFVMLVLFVVAIGYLQVKNFENVDLITQLTETNLKNKELIEELQDQQLGLIREKERLERLLNLEKQFTPLLKDETFYYLPDCKKFIAKDLMGKEIFEPNQVVIKKEYIQETKNVGKKIEAFLKELYQKDSQLSYLLVIEGNMANDYERSKPADLPDFYKKSFERALAVYNLWLADGTNFRRYNVEVMLCGSGLNGLCRDPIEENNKRFSIQIIPKVSK